MAWLSQRSDRYHSIRLDRPAGIRGPPAVRLSLAQTLEATLGRNGHFEIHRYSNTGGAGKQRG